MVTETVLRVISEWPNPMKDTERISIRLVSWNNNQPVLEKRRQYKADDGWRNAKLTGFNAEDLCQLQTSGELDKIIDEMNSFKKKWKK